MAKKVVKKSGKKQTKKRVKKVAAKKEVVSSGTSKSVRQKEDRQLLWFFVIVIGFFAAFLIPYWYAQSAKTFEYEGIDWVIEEAGDISIYHGRFAALNPNIHMVNKRVVHHNIYLRGDPRENDITVRGALDNFRFGGIVSISPEFDECRGDIPRAMIDFSDFLRNGIGMADVQLATTSEAVANETGRPLVDCSYNESRTVFVMDRGDESAIVVSDDNPHCYVITTADCSDIRPLEKFMVRTVFDFHAKHGSVVSGAKE